MKRLDLISSLVFIGSGVFVCMSAIGMSLGSLRYPGPGLYPLILGIILVLLALLLGTSAVFRGDRGQKGATKKSHSRQVWAIIATLLTYAVLLPRAGYTLATLLLLGSLFRLGGVQSWWYASMLTVLFTIATEILAIVFGIPLPRGLVWQH